MKENSIFKKDNVLFNRPTITNKKFREITVKIFLLFPGIFFKIQSNKLTKYQKAL